MTTLFRLKVRNGLNIFLLARRIHVRKRGLCYGNVASWLGVCLVTRRYCIKTAKPILKLFRPSGSPIIQFFLTLVPIPNSKGNPVISPKLPQSGRE